MLDIDLDVRQPRGAARAAQRRRRRPRLLTTADGRGALTSTLCTLERCQRPRSASPADLLLVLDVPSARAEGTVVLNAIVTHTRSRNTCNVKSMISGPPRAGPRQRQAYMPTRWPENGLVYTTSVYQLNTGCIVNPCGGVKTITQPFNYDYRAGVLAPPWRCR